MLFFLPKLIVIYVFAPHNTLWPSALRCTAVAIKMTLGCMYVSCKRYKDALDLFQVVQVCARALYGVQVLLRFYEALAE